MDKSRLIWVLMGALLLLGCVGVVLALTLFEGQNRATALGSVVAVESVLLFTLSVHLDRGP